MKQPNPSLKTLKAQGRAAKVHLGENWYLSGYVYQGYFYPQDEWFNGVSNRSLCDAPPRVGTFPLEAIQRHNARLELLDWKKQRKHLA